MAKPSEPPADDARQRYERARGGLPRTVGREQPGNRLGGVVAQVEGPRRVFAVKPHVTGIRLVLPGRPRTWGSGRVLHVTAIADQRSSPATEALGRRFGT